MLKTLRDSDKSFPFIFLAVCLLAYGIFIPWLGFYWDDWPVILMGKFFGVNAYSDFYIYDRPFSAWTYIVSLPILGFRPVVWQFFTLFLRLGTGLFFWLTMRRLWPQQRVQTAWMAIIFLLHPVFTLQFISVAFSQHWTVAFLYSFSVWAMLNSFGNDWKRWVWWILALGASALNLFTMEYFLGMEIFRYVLIWLTLDAGSVRQRLAVFIRRALPYILVLAFFIVWRLFIFEFPQEDPNPIRFLQDFGNQPFTALLTLGQIILRDLLYMIFQVWASVLDSSRLVLSSKFFLFALLFSGAVASGLALYFSRFVSHPTESASLASSWIRQAFWVGLLAVVLGTLPGWITYREALNPPYGNRIAIPALMGLGILTVVLIEWLTQNQNRRTILLSILCGISVFSHLHVANSYREAWNIQRSLYWQLYWRMPALQPGTSVLSDSEIVLGAGEYSTVSALNLIYAREFDDIQDFPYWFFNMTQRFRSQQMNRLMTGRPLSISFRSWHFQGEENSILLVNNSLDQCMQVLSADQPENAQLPSLLTQALPQVNLDRIILDLDAASVPPAEIFGREPAHTWCYYYQKASLARQVGDWTRVIALLKEADQNGYEPSQRSEWLLFVDGYVRLGELPAAQELTTRIQTRDPRLTPLLCEYWSGQTDSPGDVRETMLQKLECNQSGDQ